MTNNFGGFGANQFPVQGGYQYAPKPAAKMTQPLTPDQIKKLRGTGTAFDLQVSQTEMYKAICTHKENGNIALTVTPEGKVFCPICGGKTRLQLLETTELKDFPLFCPKCKREMLIRAVNYKVQLIK